MRPLFLSYTFIVLQGIALLALALLGMPHLGGVLAVVLFLPAIVVDSWCVGAPAGYLLTLLGSFAIGSPAFLSLALMSPQHTGELFFAALFAIEGGGLSFFLDHYCHDRHIEPYKKRAQLLLSHIQQLERENEQAREEIRLRDEFLSIASHELKTPLTSMLLHIQTALHNIRTVSLADFSIEKLMQMLERTQNQTKRLSKMINDLLNVSLITTGKLNLERESVDLARLVADVVASFSERAKKDGYLIDVQTEPVTGEWDKFRVEQAMTNLISNALKYGDKKPITVQVRRRNGAAQVMITDHGIGIPEEKREQIFHLFERGISSQQYKGLGVGLYITRQIITAHGGTISVSSAVGKGSTFMLDLPMSISS